MPCINGMPTSVGCPYQWRAAKHTQREKLGMPCISWMPTSVECPYQWRAAEYTRKEKLGMPVRSKQGMPSISASWGTGHDKCSTTHPPGCLLSWLQRPARLPENRELVHNLWLKDSTHLQCAPFCHTRGVYAVPEKVSICRTTIWPPTATECMLCFREQPLALPLFCPKTWVAFHAIKALTCW